MKLQLVAAAAACAALLNAQPAASQAVFTQVSGQEIITGFVEGTVNCQGAVEPTQDFFMPCGLGVPGTIRGRVYNAVVVVADPDLSGIQTITGNVNFDADGEGPFWGSFALELNAGGSIEGVFQGTIDVVHSTTRLDGVGHGRGGAVDGFQFMIDDVHDTPAAPGVLSIRMLNPGGKH